MKLNALQAFATALEEGSVRSAAKRLGLSQPALTKAIRDLELELGTSLLIRTSQGVSPTAQGRVLVEHARKINQELETATAHIRQLSGDMWGELTVAAVPVAIMLLIPEAVRTFSAAYPNMRLRVSEELFLAQLQRLRNGEVDLAIGGIPEGLPSGEFITEVLLDTRMVVVARKGNPLANAKHLKDLAQAKWVYTGASTDSGYARTLFEQHGLPAPPLGAVVNSTLTLLSLVCAGDFIGLMPLQIAQHPLAMNVIQQIALEEAGLPLRIGVMIRRDAALSPALRQFIAHLHRAAHQVDSRAAREPAQ